MLHAETVCKSTLDLLKDILQIPDLSAMRLVGGTALSLQLGHRTSVDLDLFGNFDPTRSFRKLLVDRGHVVEGAESGDVQALVVDGVKVDLVNYPYDWISDAISQDGMKLAGLDDIVAMKLSAAANRGKKKDFIDIAVLLERFSLGQMFERYQKKFGVSEIAFALRGLTYFDDAEDDPMPKMFVPLAWNVVKTRLLSAVQDFIKLA